MLPTRRYGSAVRWIGRLTAAVRQERTTGRPPSGNGASSFHLLWRWGGSAPALVEVGATLTVLERPVVERLSFWALQASFYEGSGRRLGAGHTGLQHHPSHPQGSAVNWGGYGASGRELDGSTSDLASATGNPNTRDFGWRAGEPYRLRIGRQPDGWTAWVDDVPIRTLWVSGDRLADVMVWSEVFAHCDDPSAAVRWSDHWGLTAGGDRVSPASLEVRYQSVPDGGCSNTSSDPDGRGGVVQRTNVLRATRPGTRLPAG
jgi:hypothetical protein